MARKSPAAMAIKAPGLQRPEPPDDLNDEEAEIWNTIVGRMPPDWFLAETWPLLSVLCIHIRQSRILAEASRAFDLERLATPDGQEQFSELTKMIEREGRAISSISTRLRLTPQSRYDTQKAANRTRTGTAVRKPWEDAA